VERMNMYYL